MDDTEGSAMRAFYPSLQVLFLEEAKQEVREEVAQELDPVAKKLYKDFQTATALYERGYSGIHVGMSGLRLRQTRNDAN